MQKQKNIPQGYKLTEVGVIPEDWEIKTLGDLGTPIIGLTYSPNAISDSGTLVLRSSNIKDNALVFEDNVYVDMELPARVIVEENDILICVRNGSRQLIGKCALITKMAKGMAFGAFMSIFKTKHNSFFIFFQLQSNVLQKQLAETIGATINQITNKDLGHFIIPFPPKKEQAAIANALANIDTLIQSIKKLINKKQAIKTATMQQLLTGKKRLPEFAYREDGTPKGTKQSELGEIPEDWEVYSINQLCLYQNGISLEKYFNQNSGYKVISIGNYSNKGKYIHNNTYIDFSYKDLIRKFILKKGDLSVLLNDKTSTGMIIGRGILVCYDNQYVINQRSMILRPNDKILSLYFYFLINSDLIHKMIVAKAKPGTQIYVNTHDILDLPMLVTLNKVEQTAIATILSDMDKEIEALQARLHKTEHIKQGMMQELLTGKTRLVTPA